MAAITNKVKQVFSHNDDSTSSSPNSNSAGIGSTPSHTSAGDRTTTGTDATATRPSDGLTDSKSASTTGSTATTGTGTGGTLERTAEHIREHAHPPEHHHNQPKHDGLLDERGAKQASHDHQHLAPVTHETRHHHEVEEVERQREVDRHVHHVQHHTQPVLDSQHASEEHHQKSHPVTNIHENHVATDEDKAHFAGLKTAHDSVTDAPRERTIIDKGEKVHENTHHHVHHVVQPEIHRDTHTHDRQHTTIPVHQTTHEAPIVHQSQQHEPLSLKDFTAGGGDLSSKLKHGAELLNVSGQDCERSVDGPGETLASNLGLGSGNRTTQSATTGATPSSNSAAGTTGGAL
ncbi:hypothetical protein JCM6882_009296 [Rhodosporidiobolus microsporus]